MLRALELYRDEHRPTGGFLRAVLENDLLEAVGRADPVSLAAIREIVLWAHWELPGGSHGSPAAVEAWLRAEETVEVAS